MSCFKELSKVNIENTGLNYNFNCIYRGHNNIGWFIYFDFRKEVLGLKIITKFKVIVDT